MSTEKEIKDAAVKDTAAAIAKETAKDTAAKDARTSRWGLDSGLPDDFDATITKAQFCTKPDYQDGTVPLLELTLEGPDIDPTEVVFSLGKGWIIKDGGARVENEKGKLRFVSSSIYGKLIYRVTEELKVDMDSRGSPMEADVWVGLSFHWEREELSYKGLETEKKIVHLLPTQYLSDFAVAKAAAVPPVNPEMEKKLQEIAKNSKTHMAFFQQVTKDFPNIGNDQAMLTLVLDSSQSGFYGRLHPELFIK
jgi:hypothetical protein